MLAATFQGRASEMLLCNTPAIRSRIHYLMHSVCAALVNTSDPDVVWRRRGQRRARELLSHQVSGISPATPMRKRSLPLRRSALLSASRVTPETRARKRAEVTPNANGNRVSGRNLCR